MVDFCRGHADDAGVICQMRKLQVSVRNCESQFSCMITMHSIQVVIVAV